MLLGPLSWYAAPEGSAAADDAKSANQVSCSHATEMLVEQLSIRKLSGAAGRVVDARMWYPLPLGAVPARPPRQWWASSSEGLCAVISRSVWLMKASVVIVAAVSFASSARGCLHISSRSGRCAHCTWTRRARHAPIGKEEHVILTVAIQHMPSSVRCSLRAQRPFLVLQA